MNKRDDSQRLSHTVTSEPTTEVTPPIRIKPLPFRSLVQNGSHHVKRDKIPDVLQSELRLIHRYLLKPILALIIIFLFILILPMSKKYSNLSMLKIYEFKNDRGQDNITTGL